MMSCFHMIRKMQIQAVGELFTVTRQVTLLNCAPGYEVRYRRLPC